jgi:hypothetical protein
MNSGVLSRRRFVKDCFTSEFAVDETFAFPLILARVMKEITHVSVRIKYLAFVVSPPGCPRIIVIRFVSRISGIGSDWCYSRELNPSPHIKSRVLRQVFERMGKLYGKVEPVRTDYVLAHNPQAVCAGGLLEESDNI